MRFKIGDIVYHETFGLGKVVGITKYGKDDYLNIRFDKNSTVGIKSICENKDLLLSESLYKAIKEFKKKEHITATDVDEFIRTHITKVFNDDISASDKITLFCKEFLLNETYVISCLKKSEKESLISNIKSDMKGYVPKKRIEELYENNKLLIDYSSIENLVEKHNKEFMEKEVEKYPEVFTTVDKKPLNKEQKLAVVSDEDNCLVIAGAGCGKTSMILAKVNYLIHKGVNPKKILVLSYTKKTVEDLNNNLKDIGLNEMASTFHGLGSKIIGGRYNDNVKVGNILRQILFPEREEYNIKIRNIKNLFETIKRLFLDLLAYYNNQRDITIISTINKYTIDDYEAQLFPTLRAEIEYIEKQNQTIQGEQVKSLAEVKIANFLFLNGIDYEYERVYDKKYNGSQADENKQYRPDFYIKNGNDEIWLEHFGITTDEQGNKHASWCKDEAKYLRQMEEKIKTHGDQLIFTTSDMLHNDTLLTELEKKLTDRGVVLKPISNDKIREYLDKLHEMSRYEALISRIERAINLFKSQRRIKSIREWEEKVLSIVPDIYRSSTINLFKIINKIYDLYKRTLKDNNSTDFSDMISDAIDKLKQKPAEYAYDYILIDEYQDITNIRYEFIQALKKVNNAKLLAVGDDWQSIYGFDGSDISLFTNFADLFDDAEELYITKTHRNSQQLLNITQKFIEKNPAQKKKKLLSDKNDDEYPIKAVLYYKSKKDTDSVQGCDNISKALMIALDSIMAKKKDNETVCIIGRYNINKPNKYFVPQEGTEKELYYKSNDSNNGFNIYYKEKCFEFSTIHKAKGREWDYTILLDGIFDENGKNSFPCTLTDDYIVKPLLYRTDTYLYAEERRMLYVALTRCKKQCYWLISEEKPTPFYEKEEMKQDIQIINDTLAEYCKKTGNELCPACGCGIYGEHVSNRNKEHKFWACDNYNCSAISNEKGVKKCPKCKRGILVKRPNKESGNEFLGCTNFPLCSYTESLDVNTEEKREKLKRLLDL